MHLVLDGSGREAEWSSFSSAYPGPSVSECVRGGLLDETWNKSQIKKKKEGPEGLSFWGQGTSGIYYCESDKYIEGPDSSGQ